MLRLILLIVFATLLNASENAAQLKVMSLNIRYDTPADGLNAWSQRKDFLIETLKNESPEIIGLQEVLWHQLQTLDSALTNYDYYGVGRDDGARKGEFSPIFFKKDRFQLLFAKTVWLSDQPNVPGSVGKGAVFPRILTLVALYDVKAGRKLWVANTHFSHVSDSARLQAMHILLNTCQHYAGQQPLIVMGDFNAEQNSTVYHLAVTYPKLHLQDTFVASALGHSGGMQTFNDFGKNQKQTIIDHIFCNGQFQVKKHYFLPLKKGPMFISDHFPVVAILQLGKTTVESGQKHNAGKRTR